MSKIYFPFDDGVGGNSYEDRWAKMAKLWRQTGVVARIGNGLETYADSTGMQVKVKSGGAWIEGFYFESDAEETVAIGAADGSNPRVDVVVVRLDWSGNTIDFAVLEGTAAVSPVAEAVTQSSATWEIALAEVYVDTGVVTIAAGKVTDRRTMSPEQISLGMVLALNGIRN